MVNKSKVCKSNKVFLISLSLFVYSLIVLVLGIFSSDFAEMYCRSISSVLRWFFSAATGFFTFSIAEMFVFAFPVLIAVVVFATVKSICKDRFSWKKFFKIVLSVVFIVTFVFVNNFAICYFRKPLEINMNLPKEQISRNEIYDVTAYLHEKLKLSVNDVEFSDDGSSVNPHSWLKMDELIDTGFDNLSETNPFISVIHSKPKKIIMSPIMTYTHISGAYMPFTGEANINTNYPDYVVAFTVAHEKAHQRGIAGEDEANFVAFLALIESGDKYLRYSALMNMYDYFLDAAYKNDEELYYYFLDSTNELIKGEMYSYYCFFKKYSDSDAAKVADVVNDTYLKTMGNSEGVESYGKVVELFSAYIDKNKGLPI